jgi:hypothetical protein
MQLGKVPGITAAWKAAGEPYCDHSRKDKEYYLGADTGDWVCLDCGVSWSRGEPTPPPRGTPPSPDFA